MIGAALESLLLQPLAAASWAFHFLGSTHPTIWDSSCDVLRQVKLRMSISLHRERPSLLPSRPNQEGYDADE